MESDWKQPEYVPAKSDEAPGRGKGRATLSFLLKIKASPTLHMNTFPFIDI